MDDRYLCPPFVSMADLVIPAKSGDVKLDVCEVSPERAKFENIGFAMKAPALRLSVAPGRYARLVRGGVVWMSDTPAERVSNLPLYKAATGDVLMLGLGIGMLPMALARKESVTSITVVEVDPRVIDVVAPTLALSGTEVRIVHGDAFLPERTGLPRVKDGGGYDTILADIWPTICADDRVEHIAVKRAWRAWRRQGAHHVTWQEGFVKWGWDQDRNYYGGTTAMQLATELLMEKRAED